MKIRNHVEGSANTLLLAAILIISMSGAGATQALSQARTAGEPASLREEVVRIESDPDPESRYQAVRQLVIVLRHDRSNVVESDVTALARLLEDSSDLVRGRAAVALGLIGPRALHAVPALQAALSEVECVRAEQNSRFAILVALRRIGASPVLSECVPTPSYGLR